MSSSDGASVAMCNVNVSCPWHLARPRRPVLPAPASLGRVGQLFGQLEEGHAEMTTRECRVQHVAPLAAWSGPGADT
jgi:hypothetical protein